MLLMKESGLSFEEKTTQPWFTYFQNALVSILAGSAIPYVSQHKVTN